jgi:hypothetical protein
MRASHSEEKVACREADIQIVISTHTEKSVFKGALIAHAHPCAENLFVWGMDGMSDLWSGKEEINCKVVGADRVHWF